MKKCIRVLAIVLALVIMGSLLSGCFLKSKIIGKWNVDQESMSRLFPSGIITSMSFEFKKDGTGTVKSTGYSTSTDKLTWTLDGNRIEMKVVGEDGDSFTFPSAMTVKIDGNKMSITDDSGFVVNMTRAK